MKKHHRKEGNKFYEEQAFPLPKYEPAEDIYNQEQKEPFEEYLQDVGIRPGDKIGEDLDIPGSELDDADEAIGEEDEENNYYSLGGDNHEGLEEN